MDTPKFWMPFFSGQSLLLSTTVLNVHQATYKFSKPPLEKHPLSLNSYESFQKLSFTYKYPYLISQLQQLTVLQLVVSY